MADFVFKRYEMKYLLTKEQYDFMKIEIMKRLSEDKFGENTIQSLYYDTPSYQIIRASLEKTIYKEKLRLRCYNLNTTNSDIYLEMKRKYNGIVYKRRIALKENEIDNLFVKNDDDSQIKRELKYFIDFYDDLKPKILIIYDREAYYDINSSLRVTFDKNIRYRKKQLNFHTSLDGEKIFDNDLYLMEIKISTSIPLWLCNLLDKAHIYKTSFSKYGYIFKKEFEVKKMEEINYV